MGIHHLQNLQEFVQTLSFDVTKIFPENSGDVFDSKACVQERFFRDKSLSIINRCKKHSRSFYSFLPISTIMQNETKR